MNYKTKFSFLYLFLVSLAIDCIICAQSDIKIAIEPGAYNTEEYIHLLNNKRIGVVANSGSLVGNTNLIDTLLASGVNIKRIFSPEHGFTGKADAGSHVGNEQYGITKIPIASLYGKTKKPSLADLADIEIIIFDLQDVGVRFYTYLSTLHFVMEACAEENLALIVLDRPNPNGFYVDGPILENEFQSFVGMHPVPVVYGMTIGEYAQMINGEGWLKNSVKCNLTVIKCRNYSHTSFYELPLSPSPNLKDIRAIYLYPSIAFFEGTIVTEGRGTDFPFTVAGHPDYSDHQFSFKPESKQGASLNPKLNGLTCYGIDLRSVSIDKLRQADQINIDYLLEFYKDLNFGDKFFVPFFDKLAGTDKFRSMILDGKSESEIRESWKKDILQFKKIRVKYLLYPDFE